MRTCGQCLFWQKIAIEDKAKLGMLSAPTGDQGTCTAEPPKVITAVTPSGMIVQALDPPVKADRHHCRLFQERESYAAH